MTNNQEQPTDLATKHPIHAYDLYIAGVAIIAIAMVVWQLFFPLKSEFVRLFVLFDFVFCGLFFIDYIRQIVLAKRKWKYIFTWGLLDLGSSVPVFPQFRFLRLAQILRVLWIIRSFRILSLVVIRDRIASAVSVAALVGVLVIVGACIGVLHFEQQDPSANIKTGEEVAWWAVVTSSTVGYGDYYPVTDGGRLLAILIMCVGIGLFATFAGALASFIMTRKKTGHPETPSERFDALTDQNHKIMKRLEALEAKFPDPPDQAKKQA